MHFTYQIYRFSYVINNLDTIIIMTMTLYSEGYNEVFYAQYLQINVDVLTQA